MDSSGPSRAQTPGEDEYGPKSATYAAPIDITDRDGEAEVDEEWAQPERAAEEAAKDSPAPSELGVPAVTPVAPVKSTTRGKRKVADTREAHAATPPQDSTTLAAAPILMPAPFVPPPQGFFLTRGHPINKPGYRYIPCGPAPGCSLTHPLYRVIPSPPSDCVRFSWEDRSQYIGISKDAMTVMADKGFRSARANVPIREGTWYFEVLVQKGGGDAGSWKGGGAHVRIGVGRRESPLTAPVGFDGYSYGIRDKTGEAVTLSQPKAYGPTFGTGDVIGVLLTLPPRREADLDDPSDPAHLTRKRIPIRYKGQLYFESLEYPSTREMAEVQAALTDKGKKKAAPKVKAAAPGTRRAPQILPPPTRPLPKLEGSRLEFFKNGESLGLAFENLYDYLPLRAHPRPRHAKPLAPGSDAARENHHDDGSCGYYPLISCFGGGVAQLVPGPDFQHPPSEMHGPWRPLSERFPEYMAETLALDERDEAELRVVFDAEAEDLKRKLRKNNPALAAKLFVAEAADSPMSADTGTPAASDSNAMQIDEVVPKVEESVKMEVDA